MKNIGSVCVYCGSCMGKEDTYRQAAEELGMILAESHIRLVYGGGHVGLMGVVSDAVLAHGGEVTGIIPSHIADRELAHTKLTELHVVETMHERKQMMVDRAEAFIIMPGGLGTMDEFFEIFTWWQLELHDKPIVILNTGGYWNPLLTMIDNIVGQGFARQTDRDHIIVVDRPDEILEALARAPQERVPAQTKWI